MDRISKSVRKLSFFHLCKSVELPLLVYSLLPKWYEAKME